MNRGFGIFNFILITLVFSTTSLIFYYKLANIKVHKTHKKILNCEQFSDFGICIKKIPLKYDFNKIFKNSIICKNCTKIKLEKSQSYFGKLNLDYMESFNDNLLASSGSIYIKQLNINNNLMILSLGSIFVDKITCSGSLYLYSEIGEVKINKTTCPTYIRDINNKSYKSFIVTPPLSEQIIYNINY